MHALTVAAAIIEELDDGHVAFRVAGYGTGRVGEQLLHVGGDGPLGTFFFRRLALFLVAPDRLEQHFRMLEDVLLHHLLKLLFLSIAETLVSLAGGRYQAHGNDGEDGKSAGKPHGKYLQYFARASFTVMPHAASA